MRWPPHLYILLTIKNKLFPEKLLLILLLVLCCFYRSSHRRCSVRKGALRVFSKFAGKYLYQGLIFNIVAGMRPATLLKKRL